MKNALGYENVLKYVKSALESYDKGVTNASHLEPYQLFNFTFAFEYISHASAYAENVSECVKSATKASHVKPYQLFNFTIAFEYIHHASEYAEMFRST